MTAHPSSRSKAAAARRFPCSPASRVTWWTSRNPERRVGLCAIGSRRLDHYSTEADPIRTRAPGVAVRPLPRIALIAVLASMPVFGRAVTTQPVEFLHIFTATDGYVPGALTLGADG